MVAVDRDEDQGSRIADALKRCGAPQVHFEQADVSNEAQVVAAFDRVLGAVGRIDCVFANAGVNRRVASFTDLDSETWHQLLDVNLHGAFYTLREGARHMKQRAARGDSGGSLVACGSLSIFHGLQGMEHYAAAKGALFAMIKSLAVELGPYGIRANMLVPGFIKTGLTARDPRAAPVIEKFAAITPLGRVG